MNGLLPAVVLEGEPMPTYSLQERMARYGVPGLSLAVIDDGHVEWAAGYGVLEAGQADSVTVSTLFQAASISKPVTALAALRLVDRGRLDLDRDVNRYLRSWHVPENAYTSKRPVTLRLLLSHGAGLTVSGFPGYQRGEPVPSAVGVLEGRGNTDPVRVDTVPGARYRYSGGGSTVVQVLIEEVTGTSFDEALERLVLDPLRMYRSTFAQPLPHRLHGAAATGHRDGATPVEGRWHVYPEKAAAGLWSTPTDLARFALGVRDAFLGREGAVLSRPLAREMLTRQNRVYGLGPGVFASGDSLWFAHSGGNAGYRAYFLLYPATGDGVAVMTNGDGGRALNFEVIRAVSRAYGWPSNKPEVRPAVALPPDALDAYTGVYRVGGPESRSDRSEPVYRIEREGRRLFLSWPEAADRERRRLVPISPTEFVVSEIGWLVEFEPNGHAGEVEIDGRRAERTAPG